MHGFITLSDVTSYDKYKLCILVDGMLCLKDLTVYTMDNFAQ